MKKDIRDYKNVGVQYAYILDAIHTDKLFEYPLSDMGKIVYFFETFNKEYNYDYNKLCYPNLQDRVAEYIKGLPSCIGIAFSDYDIEQIGKSWGCCKTDKQTAKFVNGWFDAIAYRLIQLANYYNINI